MINRRNVLKATAVGGSGLAALAYSPKPTLAASDWTANSPSQVSNENGELSSLEIPENGFSFSLDYSGLGAGIHSIEFELESKLAGDSSFESVFSDSFEVEGDSGTVNESNLSTSFPVDLLAETSMRANDFNEGNVGDTESTTVDLRVSFSWSDGEYSASSSATSSFDISVEKKPVGPTNGLVAYYPFNGDVDDAWGDNDGTDNTSAGYSSGQLGQSKDFDGTDDWIEIPDDPSINLAGERTISFWFHPRDLGSTTQNIFAKGFGQGKAVEYEYWVALLGDRLEFRVSDGEDHIIQLNYPDSKMDTNQWQHAALTWDGTMDSSGALLYFNGSVVDSQASLNDTAATSTDQTEAGAFGRRGAGGNDHTGTGDRFYYDGLIDDFRIYNRELSDSEITDVYNATS